MWLPLTWTWKRSSMYVWSSMYVILHTILPWTHCLSIYGGFLSLLLCLSEHIVDRACCIVRTLVVWWWCFFGSAWICRDCCFFRKYSWSVTRHQIATYLSSIDHVDLMLGSAISCMRSISNSMQHLTSCSIVLESLAGFFSVLIALLPPRTHANSDRRAWILSLLVDSCSSCPATALTSSHSSKMSGSSSLSALEALYALLPR